MASSSSAAGAGAGAGAGGGSSSSSVGISLGLRRITSLLDSLGRPERGFAVIHVAGTNAKGSTTAYLDSLLSRVTHTRTGRFNSPHLVSERDACRVNGALIAEAVWEEAGKRVQAADAAQELRCSPFELLTARAFTAFRLLPARDRPEVLLIEVGLGGLLDATNVFSARDVLASVICPVDLDHQSLLGSTLAEIAAHKAGIIRPGGLCVVADQRRGEAAQRAEPECTAWRGVEVERAQVGDAAQIHEAIRATAVGARARLCKAYVPWHVLDSAPQASTSSAAPWATSVLVHARHAPLLYPSSSSSPSFAGTYAARPGDGLVSGPLLELPRTRAALSGATTALQTFWAIARDETPGGLGRDGSDEHEELRLRIAWALRDDRDANEAIGEAVKRTKWEGRAAWLDVPLEMPSTTSLPTPTPTQQVTQGPANDDMQLDDVTDADAAAPAPLSSAASGAASHSHSHSQAAPQTLHVLTDGAHNVSACAALQAYIDDCIAARLSSPSPRDGRDGAATKENETGEVTLTITYLLAFSAGKDVRGMLSALLQPQTLAAQEAETMEAQLARTTLNASSSSSSTPPPRPLRSNIKQRIRVRVGLLAFSTPVEGMPWVSPLAPHAAAEALRSMTRSSSAGADADGEMEVRLFSPSPSPSPETEMETQTLAEALSWAAQAGDGRSLRPGVGGEGEAKAEASMCVVAGSLYLVGDLYRLLARSSRE